MNGNDIIIYRGSTLIGGVKSNDIASSAETMEVASENTGQWKEFIAGRKEWSVNVNWLLLADADMLELLNVGTTYTIKTGGRNASAANTLQGQAILTACKVTSTRGNLVQGAFTFKGSGALTAATT